MAMFADIVFGYDDSADVVQSRILNYVLSSCLGIGCVC
jgi:hypothetical protein